MTLKQVIEALVFASPKPLLTKEIVSALKAAGNSDQTDNQLAIDYAKAKEVEVHAVLLDLQSEYVQTGRAFRLSDAVLPVGVALGLIVTGAGRARARPW